MPVIGPMVGMSKHERGKSDARLGYMEEGVGGGGGRKED